MQSLTQKKLLYYFFLLLLFVAICSCKKESNPEPTTVTDVDGNVYPILKIGTQTWMTENLRTSKYNDGSAITTNLTNPDWSANTTGAYTVYDNVESNNSTYGKLYNWHAVHTAKLAPKGWHIPSQQEWEVLITFLEGSSLAGGKMKSTSSVWEAPNTGANNSSGFNGLPGGYRSNSGLFSLLGKSGYWWASSERNTTQGDYLLLDNDFNSTAINGATKSFGYSIRCIKD